MHRLRTSFLLRGSERLLTAALLVAAQAAFLWMFFVADVLEQLGGGERAAIRFASDWRHGTAGNAWLYMPGFFATAAASWLAAPLFSGTPVTFLVRVMALATALSAVGSCWFGTPRIIGVIRGLYTLATWTVFVLACRRALVDRAWRPFVAPAVMGIGLAFVRPWTLGEVGGDWRARAAAGDPIAWGSALAIPVVVLLLVASVQCSQSRTKPVCPAATRRATTANRT